MMMMIRAYSSWKSKIQYLKILEYFLRSIKKGFAKQKSSSSFKVWSFLHSVLGRGSFSTNSSISEEWMEAISRWHCWGNIQLVCIVVSTVSLLSPENIPYIPDGVQVRHIVWPIKHSYIIVSKPLEVGLAVWAGAKVLLEKEISISIKLVSRWKHKELQNLLVDGQLTLDLIKHNEPTPADVTASQFITDLGNFTLDFKQLGFCASPVFLQTLIYKWNVKGLRTTEQQSSSCSP